MLVMTDIFEVSLLSWNLKLLKKSIRRISTLFFSVKVAFIRKRRLFFGIILIERKRPMDLQKELNTNQYLAAKSDAQYLRIIAGAGTGKTRTLTYRLAYHILNGMEPRRMLAITFTNKAAKEMLSRVKSLLEKEEFQGNGFPLICTFHGFCYRFLRKEITNISGFNASFQIAGEEETNAIYKEIFSHMTKGESKDFVGEIVDKISKLKTEGKFPNEVTQSDIPLDALYTYDELIGVYRGYQHKLAIQNLLDFDDLLMLTTYIMENNEEIRRYWQSKYDMFLVDEFQDTNFLQYNLVRLFMSKKAKLAVVGDPDQTIYTWRGAKNEIIKTRLEQDFPTLETIILDENYRSTQAILNCANELISHNGNRMEKKLIAASGEKGSPVEYYSSRDGEEEAYHIATKIRQLYQTNVGYGDIAIIYRSNYLSNSIEKKLTAFKIPYEIYGGMKFYERAEIKDAISYLRLLVNPDDYSFKRILKAPTKGIGEVVLGKAEQLRERLGEEIPLMNVFREHQDEIGLTRKSKMALEIFFRAYDACLAVKDTYRDVEQLGSAIQHYFNETGFLEYVHKEDSKTQQKLSYTASSSISKVDNVNELLRSIVDFFNKDVVKEDGTTEAPSLEEFLIDVALQSDQDAMEDQPKVSLMTGHVSKGLEFPYVFLTGLNQMIFPTSHACTSRNIKASIEEERRLMYVCMTRAKKKLYLSSFGGKNFRTGTPYEPSMFIKEINIAKPHPQTMQNPYQNSYYNAHAGEHRPSVNQPGLSFDALSIVNQQMKALQQSQRTQKEENYAVGDRIAHTSFGVGTVVAINGEKLTVKFNDPYCEKKLMKGFKAFRKLKEDE